MNFDIDTDPSNAPCPRPTQLNQLVQKIESSLVLARSMKDDQGKSSSQLQYLQDQNQRLHLKLRDLTRTEESLSSKLSQLELAENSAALQLQKLNSELSGQQQEITRYRKIWPEVLQKDHQIKKLTSERSELARRLEEQKKQSADLNDRLAFQTVKSEQFEKQVHQLHDQNHNFSQESKTYREKIMGLQKDLERYQADIKTLKTEAKNALFQSQMDYQKNLDQQKIEIQSKMHENYIIEKQKIIGAHSQLLSDRDSKISSMLAQSEARKHELVTVLMERDKLKLEIQCYQGKLKTEEDQKNKENQKHQELEKALQRLKNECRLLQEILLEEKRKNQERLQTVLMQSSGPSPQS